jgi:nicotinamidase-related amidase
MRVRLPLTTMSLAFAETAMDTFIVVDMQAGLLNGPPKYDLPGVVERINRLMANVRHQAGTVILVQHCGGAGEEFAWQTPGWAFLPALQRHHTDIVVHKSLNDPFVGTDLQATLTKIAPNRVLVAGWATDFCVDATVRSAVSNDHHVVVVADGHTLSDRPHLDARVLIRHHNWVWSNLITRRSVRLANTEELLGGDALRL